MITLGTCVHNFDTWTFEDAVRLSRDIGFSVADVSKGHVGGMEAICRHPEKVGRRIRAAAEEHGMTFVEFFAFGIQADAGTSDPVEGATENFRRICACAAAGGLRSVLGSIEVPPGEVLSEDVELERWAGLLRKSVAVGREFGLEINIEPMFNSCLVRDTAQAIRLAQQVEGIGFTTDIAHWLAIGRTTEEAFPLLPYTRHMHVKQTSAGFLKDVYHRGAIDFAAVIRELKRIDWDGVMVLECLAYGKDERFDYGVYQPVDVEFRSLPAEGRVCHPVWQSIVLAYEVERCIQKATD